MKRGLIARGSSNRKAWNSTLKVGKRGGRLRSISKKAWNLFAKDRDWTFGVYGEQLALDGWMDKSVAPCQMCGRIFAWIDLTLDHFLSRNSRPDLKHNPNNFGVVCKNCNKNKDGQVVPEYRGKKFLVWLKICIMRDWSKIGTNYYR
ncbi:MAG: HNH endonuclease [Desulfatiglandales bacterium]